MYHHHSTTSSSSNDDVDGDADWFDEDLDGPLMDRRHGGEGEGEGGREGADGSSSDAEDQERETSVWGASGSSLVRRLLVSASADMAGALQQLGTALDPWSRSRRATRANPLADVNNHGGISDEDDDDDDHHNRERNNTGGGVSHRVGSDREDSDEEDSRSDSGFSSHGDDEAAQTLPNWSVIAHIIASAKFHSPATNDSLSNFSSCGHLERFLHATGTGSANSRNTTLSDAERRGDSLSSSSSSQPHGREREGVWRRSRPTAAGDRSDDVQGHRLVLGTWRAVRQHLWLVQECTISWSPMDTLPYLFHLLPNLEKLIVHGDPTTQNRGLQVFAHAMGGRIAEFPPSQDCRLSSLAHCSKLKEIDVSRNSLLELHGIRTMGALPSLEILRACSNPLKVLVPDDLGGLANLRILDLQTTRLSSLFDVAHVLENAAPRLEEVWFQRVCFGPEGVDRAAQHELRNLAFTTKFTSCDHCSAWSTRSDAMHFDFRSVSWLARIKHYRLVMEYVLGKRPTRVLLDGIPVLREVDVPLEPLNEDVPGSRSQVVQMVTLYFGSSFSRFSNNSVRRLVSEPDVTTTQNFDKRTRLALPGSFGRASLYSYRLLFHTRRASKTQPLPEPGTQPRQFEYHPTVPGRFVYGDLSGRLTVLNPSTGKVLARSEPTTKCPVLGISWLQTNANSGNLLAGTEDGQLHAYRLKSSDTSGAFFLVRTTSGTTFERFQNLTSVNSNCDDSMVVVCGHNRRVNLRTYDVATGKTIRSYERVHEEGVNVSKFARTSPFVFASSSFDRTVKVWDVRSSGMEPIASLVTTTPATMCVWSPDDQYLLVSGVDNDVCQFTTLDGLRSVHLQLPSASGASDNVFGRKTSLDVQRFGWEHNYTRAYYMDSGRSIVVGSVCESVVTVFDANLGRCIRSVELADCFLGKESTVAPNHQNSQPFVQSLRGDEFTPMSFTALLYDASDPEDDCAVLANVQLYPGGGHRAETSPFFLGNS